MDEGSDGGQFKFKEPIWYNEKWTRQVVKGNFMTIVARPKIVDDGEWIAHQGMLFNIYSISLPSPMQFYGDNALNTSATIYLASY